mmetsp:Transcript_38779/g.82394  ORF Transcript_38779/g.82394 Transcript_38779/m.82394 type:complete len:231 (-) Transcript_38779:3308-4000(-)
MSSFSPDAACIPGADVSASDADTETVAGADAAADSGASVGTGAGAAASCSSVASSCTRDAVEAAASAEPDDSSVGNLASCLDSAAGSVDTVAARGSSEAVEGWLVIPCRRDRLLSMAAIDICRAPSMSTSKYWPSLQRSNRECSVALCRTAATSLTISGIEPGQANLPNAASNSGDWHVPSVLTNLFHRSIRSSLGVGSSSLPNKSSIQISSQTSWAAARSIKVFKGRTL